MPVEPFVRSGVGVDLSSRVVKTAVVSASPSGATETVVATTPAFDASIPFASGVLVMVDLAYTLGTSAASATVRIRQTDVNGTVLYSTGAQTGGHNTATQLVSDSATAFDTAPAVGQKYCVTLTVASGAAASTVSAVALIAIAI